MRKTAILSATTASSIWTTGSEMMEKFDYVIIGGGLAGGNAAISIRENDPNGTILLIANENHLPYDRVPLSKNFLYGSMPKEALL